MKKLQALVLLFALTVTVAGGLTVATSRKADAARCCWVMVCSSSPPIVCWEVCKTCPKF